MKGVIQIGAHYAEEHEGFMSLGAENFLYFEPVKANFEKLKLIVGNKPGVELRNMALGNFRGITKIHIETSHQGKSCSILEPTLHLEQYPDIVFTGTEFININKLDDVKYDRSLYDHLHIDTQGYEMEVLTGAERSLKHIQTLTVEVYREELFLGCAQFGDVNALLTKWGFSLANVFWRGMTWGDADYKRL